MKEQQSKQNTFFIIKSKLQSLKEEWDILTCSRGGDSRELATDADIQVKNLSSAMLPRLSSLLNFISKIFGALLGFLSIIMIISEMTIFLGLNMSLFGYLIDYFHEYFILIVVFTMIPLTYLISTTIYALFHLKVSGVYGIYKNRHTDSESLLILSGFMCRVCFPLALNFIQLLKLGIPTITTKIINTKSFIPFLGQKFTIFFPVILGLLCVLNYFNFFASLMSCIGLSYFGFETDATNNQIIEGNLIFERSKLYL